MRIDLNFAIEAHTEGTLWYIAAVRNLSCSCDLAGCKSCFYWDQPCRPQTSTLMLSIYIKGMDLCVLYIGGHSSLRFLCHRNRSPRIGFSRIFGSVTCFQAYEWLLLSRSSFLASFVLHLSTRKKVIRVLDSWQVSLARLDIDRSIPFSFFSMGHEYMNSINNGSPKINIQIDKNYIYLHFIISLISLLTGRARACAFWSKFSLQGLLTILKTFPRKQ